MTSMMLFIDDSSVLSSASMGSSYSCSSVTFLSIGAISGGVDCVGRDSIVLTHGFISVRTFSVSTDRVLAY